MIGQGYSVPKRGEKQTDDILNLQKILKLNYLINQKKHSKVTLKLWLFANTR